MIVTPEIHELLEEKSAFYNQPEFIATDPISIPHMFSKKEDIEISGFLTAIISWGQRKSIISSAKKLLEMMDYEPYDFIMNAGPGERGALGAFYHRTFNGVDCRFFVDALKNIYMQHGGLEAVFSGKSDNDMYDGILSCRKVFFGSLAPDRSQKHFADPSRGASAKRINMFLRWMVRNDGKGVDFGIWQSISPSQLYCPLDVHSGRVARKLGLIARPQSDWKAVAELTATLRVLDADDPVRFDYALFGLGVFEKF